MIGQQISHYRILEKIGEGGMGEVYLAEDLELRRRVAIKFPDSRIAEDQAGRVRFQREAQAAAALRHPNIVTIHEVAEHEGRPYLVMEHVDGSSIASLIRGGLLSYPDAIGYALQIAEGIEAAHAAGIVHRDLKPQNVLVDASGRVTILDFGLAQLEGATKLTKDASTLGTLHYMSPEQVQNSGVDRRSDIFSLGAILYEMITGKVPFAGEQAAAVMNSILHEAPEPLARYSKNANAELQRIVGKALAKAPAERYASAADLAADLRHELGRSTTDTLTAVNSVAATTTSRLRLALPLLAVAALATLFVLLRPTLFGGSPTPQLPAEQNLLAVMYFENMTDSADEARLGEILSDLLINQLSESPGLRVVSSQRLYDLLKQEGKEGVKQLDRELSSAVAGRARARWMLLGRILRMEPSPVVTAQIVEVSSGSVHASQRIDGRAGEDVFSVADQLAVEVRSDLNLSSESSTDPITTSPRAGTHSALAYRHYLEGVEHQNRYEFSEAQVSFNQAVQQDSTFAMAYYRLATMRGERNESLRFVERALQFSDQLGQKDQLLIRAAYAHLQRDIEKALEALDHAIELDPNDKEAHYRRGITLRRSDRDPHDAIQSFRKVLELDPLDKLAYNQLAYQYENIGDLGQSIWAINKYIELAPDEHNPYDSRGDLYARHGKVDQAIESYQSALRIRPRAVQSKEKLGNMYRAKRDYVQAEATYRELLDEPDPGTRSRGRCLLADLVTYQGKFSEALEQYRLGIAADRLDGAVDGWNHFDKFLLMGQIQEQLGRYDLALEAAKGLPRSEPGDTESGGESSVCEWLARSGDVEGAKRMLATIESLSRAKGRELGDAREYQHCAGMIATAEGRLDEVVEHLEAASFLDRFDRPIWTTMPLAQAYYAAGRLSEAVQVYESILWRFDESWADDPVNGSIMHYHAGRAYESSGWNDKAVERYEFFVDLWQNADPGIPILEDAKSRLERLQAEM